MDGFLGKFELMKDQTEGFEPFLTKLGVPADMIAEYKDSTYTYQTVMVGSDFKTTMEYQVQGVPNTEYSWKIGTPFQYQEADGSKPTCTITLDGTRLVEKYKEGSREWTTVREVNGDTLTATSTSDGLTMIERFKRL